LGSLRVGSNGDNPPYRETETTTPDNSGKPVSPIATEFTGELPEIILAVDSTDRKEYDTVKHGLDAVDHPTKFPRRIQIERMRGIRRSRKAA
jgi:hypothetical protein